MNKKLHIVVIGGCSLDQTIFTETNTTISNPGGKGANQAVAASRAGAKVTMISLLGNDPVAKDIIANLNANGINTDCVETMPGISSDYCEIFVNENGENDIHRHTGAINAFSPKLVKKYADVLLAADVVVAQMKAPKEFSVALINFCNANNIPLVITPCRPERLAISDEANLELIEKISLITCNQHECEVMFGTKDIEACVSKYPHKLIVTLGENGVMYHDGEKLQHIPAVKVDKVIDTTGAGDTFCGNLVAALTNGYLLHGAIVRAQYASALKIQKESAQAGMPYKDELDAFIASHKS